jgi:hypothetical protein
MVILKPNIRNSNSYLFLKEKNLKNLPILNKQQYESLMSLCEFDDQKWKLIYKAAVDGFKAKDFHQKCDGKSNTMTIIKDANANIFGGFTGASWSEYDGFKEDPYAFIFSFSNNQKEKILIKVSEPTEAIYCHKDYGPSFGNDDIKISNMSNCNQKSISNLGYSYGDSIFEFGSDDCKTFLAGAESFQTEDIEVYCKEYSNLTQVRNWDKDFSTSEIGFSTFFEKGPKNAGFTTLKF